MMDTEERRKAIGQMRETQRLFYCLAVCIGVHPFQEFAGLMNQYIDCCEDAHKRGIDFTDCSTHTGQSLPMKAHQVEYVAEKLDCIFTGRIVARP